MPLVFRAPNPDEIDDIAGRLSEAHAQSLRGIGSSSASALVVAERWRQLIADAGPSEDFVSTRVLDQPQQRSPAAAFFIAFVEQFGRAYLFGAIVNEERLGLGRIRAMLRDAEAITTARGITELYLPVASADARAIDVGRRLGYAPRAILLQKSLDQPRMVQDTGSFRIRRPRPDELPTVAELIRRSLERNLREMLLPADLALQISEVVRNAVLASDDVAFILRVAEDMTCGSIAATYLLRFDAAAAAASGLYFYVAPDYQGRALSRRLFRHGEALSRSRGMRTLEIDVFLANNRAIGIYKRLGYRDVGTWIVKRVAAHPEGRSL